MANAVAATRVLQNDYRWASFGSVAPTVVLKTMYKEKLDVEDVIELLKEIPYRADLYPTTEGYWFTISFDVEGTEYELHIDLHRGGIVLHDATNGKDLYRK